MKARYERPWLRSEWVEFFGTIALAILAIFYPGCIAVPAPVPHPPVQPAPAVWSWDVSTDPPVDCVFTVEGDPASPRPTDPTGFLFVNTLPKVLKTGALQAVCPGFDTFLEQEDWQTFETTVHNVITLHASHYDPSGVPLEQLARFRGALFTARGPLSEGPRPGQPTNAISTERAWDWWTEADWQIVLHEYRDVRHLTHIAVGPLTGDDCYHGVYRPCTQDLSEANRDRFLDFIQRLWDSGLAPVYRHKPDNWERPEHAADLDRLDALMSTPRAQRLLRIVTYAGWEPNGDKYGWSNRTYVDTLARGARVFPNALRTLHTTCDVEVPVGATDKPDSRGIREDPALVTVSPGFGNAWRNIEPYIHLWEQQICGYVEGGYEQPTADFLRELRWVLQNQPPRTRPGGMWFGPTAWGPDRGLTWVLSEWGSFRDFWDDWPEAAAVQIGNFAIQNGSDGFFDGGSVAVGSGPVPWQVPR